MVLPAQGTVIPASYSPGYIVLSYLISYVGCLTALELLTRRTHHGGYYNWFLLAGAATAMGGVAIWSMHFLGMLALIMADGEDDLQIYYNASNTAGSFFLPIVTVALSFSVFSGSSKTTIIQIIAAGVFCGAAICGMHYVGQAGIVTYTNHWDWRYILGSVLISISAASVALGVCFYLSSKWINTLWKRALCAMLLAGAVCAMHWTAILGTTFVWNGSTAQNNGLSKAGSVWVCGVLALSCCFVLLVLAVIFQYVRRRYLKKAQQISLALAYFAPDGSIMLNSDGHLPLNRITKNYLRYSAKDDFDVDSLLFSWMYRVSRNWACVTNLIPSMRVHVQLEQINDDTSTIVGGSSRSNLSTTELKELYCIAADSLSTSVGLGLSQAGFLFDGILNTGRMTHGKKTGALGRRTTMDTDVESGSFTSTRGQVLFLVRHLNRTEATRLQTSGFSFTPLKHIMGSVASSMQITPDELRPFLDGLASYKDMPQMLEVGVHVACFVVRPVIDGFEILAQRAVHNLLPSIPLPLKKLDHSQTMLLAQFDNWEASTLLQHWSMDVARRGLTDTQLELVEVMCKALNQLRGRVGTDVFEKVRLIATPVTDPGKDGKLAGAGTATIIAFQHVTDIHYMHPTNALDAFVNARLFVTQQHCYSGLPDHAVFAGQVYKEFASIQNSTLQRSKSASSVRDEPEKSKRPFSLTNPFKRTPTRRNSTPGRNQLLSSIFRHSRSKSTSTITIAPILATEEHKPTSMEQSVHTTVNEPEPLPSKTSILRSSTVGGYKPHTLFSEGGVVSGGVHVSNEIHVTITDVRNDADGSARSKGEDSIELDDMGMKTEIGAVKERESAVDTLMTLTLRDLRR